MDSTYVPSIGDSVFLHREDNNIVGKFYKVLDVNGCTMAVQAAVITGDHLEEKDLLDIILLRFDKKTGLWSWSDGQDKLVATFLQPTNKIV